MGFIGTGKIQNRESTNVKVYTVAMCCLATEFEVPSRMATMGIESIQNYGGN